MSSLPWKRSVFDLVRHVRHDLGGDTAAVARAVEAWLVSYPNPPHPWLALRYAVQCWDRSKRGTEADVLPRACRAARAGHPRAVPTGIRGAAVLVWRTCYWLSRANLVFFLPCDKAGGLLGLPSMEVWRALRRLRKVGVLKLVEIGDRFTGSATAPKDRRARASRYTMESRRES